MEAKASMSTEKPPVTRSDRGRGGPMGRLLCWLGHHKDHRYLRTSVASDMLWFFTHDQCERCGRWDDRGWPLPTD